MSLRDHKGLGGTPMFVDNVRMMPCYKTWFQPIYDTMGGNHWGLAKE